MDGVNAHEWASLRLDVLQQQMSVGQLFKTIQSFDSQMEVPCVCLTPPLWCPLQVRTNRGYYLHQFHSKASVNVASLLEHQDGGEERTTTALQSSPGNGGAVRLRCSPLVMCDADETVWVFFEEKCFGIGPTASLSDVFGSSPGSGPQAAVSCQG